MTMQAMHTKNNIYSILAIATMASSINVFAEGNVLKTINSKSIYDISLTNESRYDSNPLFSEKKTAVYRNISNVKLGSKTVYETSELYLNTGLQLIRSSEPDIFFNQELPQASANWIKSWEKQRLDTRAEYRESSARSQELTENGLLFRDNTLVYKSVNAKYITEITPTATLSADISFSNTDYKKSVGGLIGNDVLKAGLGGRKTINEFVTALINYNYTDFKPDNLSSTKLEAYTAGVDWWINENNNLIVSLGRNTSSVQNSPTGSIYSLQYNYSGIQTTYNFEYTQSTTPSALGFLLQNNRIALTINHEISALWSANLSLSRSRNENTSLLATSNVFNNLNLGLSKQVTPDFKVSLTAGVQQVERDTTINSQLVGINLIYNFSR
ncbi:hypothetical protein [Methylophilus aquaticus]|uniref:DUF481 domain-containing protein n=1 Tax=Methylophilus aquaticus TaxID=1971610 RepID=A0ABT9JT53_9PROT|nr:hypothetical protein [Methylophilus aquaticus]MDP8567750.1 hypothetical protein [Methylophilus aquaticus]